MIFCTHMTGKHKDDALTAVTGKGSGKPETRHRIMSVMLTPGAGRNMYHA